MEDPQVEINEEFIIYNKKFKLSNYPNPFNPANAGTVRNSGTTISYELPVNVENAIIEIFNIKGEKVRTFNCQNQKSITWDGTDQHRKPVASGVYLCIIKADDVMSKPKKMILLR